MRTTTLLAWAAGMAMFGCSKDDSAKGGAASASASAAMMAPSAAPSAPAMASATPSAAPSESAAPLTPRSDCPKGSAGPGTFDKPCEGKGNARLMVVEWNGKTDDKGPFFRVQNKSSLVVLYGKIDVYFYDKAGKQLELKDADGKGHPYRSCAGSTLFGGVMKPGEKAVIQFSCVKKENVPEGATAIEGELQTVGFADSTEKKIEFYWKNDDLVPDVRKKGGVK